jgi:hypothetical protein
LHSYSLPGIFYHLHGPAYLIIRALSERSFGIAILRTFMVFSFITTFGLSSVCTGIFFSFSLCRQFLNAYILFLTLQQHGSQYRKSLLFILAHSSLPFGPVPEITGQKAM